MSGAPISERELRQLLSRLCEGQASADEQRWLRDAMAEQRQVRLVYAETMAAEAMLLAHVVNAWDDRETGRPDLVNYPQVFAEETLPARSIPAVTSPPAGGHWGAQVARAIDWRVHPVRFYNISAVLTLLFAALLIYLVYSRRGETPVAQQPKGQAGVPLIVAQVTGNHRAIEQDDSAPTFVGANLQPGQTIRLASGVAEIAYRSGAEVTLQGPAEYELIGHNGGRLERGTLRARVQGEKAKGFALSAPDGVKLVDLGTEFIAQVDTAHGTPRVTAHVIEGSIRFTAGGGRSREFSAGVTARVEDGRFRLLAASDAPRIHIPPVEADPTYSLDVFDADTDISTEGVLVAAGNLGTGATDQTIGGVTFAAREKPLFGTKYAAVDFYTSAPLGSLSADAADNLLDTLEYGPGVGNTLVPLTGLTIGETYLVQLILSDHRPGARRRTYSYGHTGHGAGGSATEVYTLTTPPIEQGPFIVTVTFTARAPRQELRVRLDVPREFNAIVSAYQLRRLAAKPEPVREDAAEPQDRIT